MNKTQLKEHTQYFEHFTNEMDAFSDKMDYNRFCDLLDMIFFQTMNRAIELPDKECGVITKEAMRLKKEYKDKKWDLEQQRKHGIFRTISKEAKLKRNIGESAHRPKDFRHWYYERSAKIDQSFSDWILEMMEQIETPSDLGMLACEVRDGIKKELIDQTEFERLKKIIVDFEAEYKINILKDIEGF